jgi:DNA uptake protein ComE-like DNA-binding protein
MKLPQFHQTFTRSAIHIRKSPIVNRKSNGGSVLVIVLMISLGLISMALYFANSMTLELRAADNRASGMASDQAIEGAARYVSSVLSSYATNGTMPDLSEYSAEAVAVGSAMKPEENPHFWLIGRDLSGTIVTEPHFALVDEASKLDLNAPWLNADVLSTNVVGMTAELAEAIVDWRSTNDTSSSSLNYSQLGYLPKHSAFESVGEMRLLYGATADILAGEDINRNGVLDSNEQDSNGNGEADTGLMECFTVFSRELNTYSDGSSLTNVNNRTNLYDLLSVRINSSRATAITNQLFRVSGGGPAPAQATSYTNLLQFYLGSGMTADEFASVYPDLTATTNAFTIGRVNVNTASATVLSCLPGMDATTAQQLVSYRENNSIDYRSFAWIVDALGSSSTALQALARGDYITAKSFQFAADVAAVGPFGRGYRRVRFVFDTTEGTPKILYRQDLSRLGWALGKKTRETWIATTTR